MNCNACNFNTSNSPVSVCCKLDYPENCEKEIERIIDLSKENKESKEYKCIRKTIEFKLKDDGINIDIVGAKVINAKEGIIRL